MKQPSVAAGESLSDEWSSLSRRRRFRDALAALRERLGAKP